MNAQNINDLIQEASVYYQQILGFQPRRTKFETLNKNEWEEFCKRINLNHKSEGIFLPRNLTSYLLKDSENLYLNVFHEYFGHGLFCEYSEQGKFLERLEKRLVREEERNFKGKTFSFEELQEFRKTSPDFKLLQTERNKKLELHEIFAIWTEYHLSELFKMKDNFERKYKEMPQEIRKNLEEMLQFQQVNGELALFYEIGMPKYYDTTKVKGLLEMLFKDKINSAELMILYGSRKPYSDIDLFLVSQEIKDFTNNWLDIYAMTRQQFEYAISVFDISIIDPLLRGEIIIGDKDYFEQKKKQLNEQPITQEAIYYNLIRAKQQKILASEYPKNSKERNKGKSYARTYLKNALLLKQGVKPSIRLE